MLDLDRLFSTPAVPNSVPNCAQVHGAEKQAAGPIAVPSTNTPANPCETLSPQDPEGNSRGGGAAKVGHSGHSPTASKLPQRAQPEANNHAGFQALGTVGTLGTVGFQGGEWKTMHGAPVEGADRREFALNSSALALLLAWHEKAGSSTDKAILMDLAKLKGLEPGEQVRYWHDRCIERGLKPWMILTRPASLDGMDCTFCKHLTTRQFSNPGDRRRFDWACRLGYLILETGRGTERIWIAPPECQSYERWIPGTGAPTPKP